jgi:hypothetical protein
MKLSEFKTKVRMLNELVFIQLNGVAVPKHFHITEMGLITKHFIDCGGTIREENYVNIQLWEANDFDHRLAPSKLMNIIDLAEKKLGIKDFEVEVEYQTTTIGRYGLEFDGKNFVLTNKQTNCLASDKCGIPTEKQKVNLADLQSEKASCCTPGGGCC